MRSDLVALDDASNACSSTSSRAGRGAGARPGRCRRGCPGSAAPGTRGAAGRTRAGTGRMAARLDAVGVRRLPVLGAQQPLDSSRRCASELRYGCCAGVLTASRPPHPAARAAALSTSSSDSDRTRRSTPRHVRGLDGPGVAPEHGGDLRDGGVLEQRPHRQFVAERVAHAGHDLHGEQGVAAVLEEVVVDADLARRAACRPRCGRGPPRARRPAAPRWCRAGSAAAAREAPRSRSCRAS